MPEENYTYKAKARIPTRPLSYQNAALAIPRELLIDYTNGNIYICDLDGKIIDITNKILDKVNSSIDENNTATIQLVKDVQIVLDNGNTVTIENAIKTIYASISSLDQSVEGINNRISDIEDLIAKASSSTPLAAEDEGSVGVDNTHYALADHIHPKGKATVADSANSVEWDNIKNRPALSSESHNHDKTYLKLAGGTIEGDLIVKSGVSGFDSNGNSIKMIMIDSKDRVLIGDGNNDIMLCGALSLSDKNYGEEDPKTRFQADGASAGQLYLQFVD